MKQTQDFHFLIVVTPFTQECTYPGVFRRSMVRAWPALKNEPDARFPFPDRRHSYFSEVYSGVSYHGEWSELHRDFFLACTPTLGC